MKEKMLKHILNGFEILSYEINLNLVDPDYQNEHFKNEIKQRLKILEKELEYFENAEKLNLE